MTEIPEHLRKRAEEARKKAQEKSGAPSAGAARGSAAATRPPAAAMATRRSPRPRAASLRISSSAAAPPVPRRGGGESTGGEAPSTAVAAAAATGAVATAAPPVAAGPGGHTQRLLTVVKSGSIQDVRAEPVDKVHVWPHLLVVEFVAALVMTAFLLLFSIFVNAPLQPLANVNRTPNPSKAPWYFLGLQELLTMFHPMVAGVTIPGHRPVRADPRPVHRPQPEQQARGPQVRDRADDDVPDVLGRARHHRRVLPGSRLQLHVPLA